MVTYRCSWCGSEDRRPTGDELVPCSWCAREFARLFGFVPRTMMFPLEPGVDPGAPAATTRRFVFRDPATGEVTGRTRVITPRPEKRASGE